MPIDPAYLRRHYSSLSDEALAEIDRNQLVAAAQQCYDEEVTRRTYANPRDDPGAADSRAHSGQTQDWIEEAACACTFTVTRGREFAPEAEVARDALEAAGIPCQVDIIQVNPEPQSAEPWSECRLMVPAGLALEAGCVLDTEISNPEIEAEWRAHFETLPDEDLRAVDPRIVLGGLWDRIDRLTRAYEEELARRGLRPLSDWRVGYEG